MRNLSRLSVLALAMLAANPAFAAGGGISLKNTDFVVLLGLLVFIGILVYFKVPGMIGKMLDSRAEGIEAELNEARALREEAQSLLASYERKQREVQEQADRIVEAAKEEATIAAEQARADLEVSLARRMAAAEDQIASAQAAAIKEVRDQSVSIAIAAAQDVIAKQLTAADANALIDGAITEVEAKLH
ncbi:ATP synthase subunit b 1 [Roseobacter denitrificans]|uniref:ATP synthase subunit b 1 n=1 Tax=Roseobacter denitrificans (strain ATCC 33942 / OCh 114) TaxID=375451 RepID=ATPF1_ROSDO|nr:F0F1 ATP synthase subunit B [Roseobacter denitrificans]Q16AM5.1 RecName: Full=ATP synthase subunit b 1; AltName: Full=ATP synthase F(0) sector subunit b 1; AltName: Full=ATPase subunit I 1; AltName: Full=F-type ATPase subunit b 1; Short=F-ATPase subunit b 1 [Roseobacter denitrificans OCh 114]ABG30968.1 ATP synthase F0, B subunit [Roseobacter denitrificans OCh 114]AVL55009.1 ATP synthase subunit b 1 [Roseobacter denitrificans]SFG13361.1 ATP synthase F0 subcomplex B subunit [Roseobacter denitr